MTMKNNKGFTIIEVIIYLALFAFIIGAGVSTSYYLIDASAKGKAEVNTIAEAEFMLRKIDWALTGSILNSPTSGSDNLLSVNKNGLVEIRWNENASSTQISIANGPWERLTSERVMVTGLEFIFISPDGITASSTIDGKHFEITKYLRK